jgi:DNA-binding MarR family transcriptional regulator
MESKDPFVSKFQQLIEILMHRSVKGMLLYSKQSGLSMSQIGALFHLTKGASDVSNLGGWLGVSSAGASQMLDRLVDQGLIVRSEDPVDRRAKKLALTDEGRRVLKETVDARQVGVNELAASLTPAEKEQILLAIEILIRKSGQAEESRPASPAQE